MYLPIISRRSALAALLLLTTCGATAQNWQFTSGPNRPHEVIDIAVGKNGSTQKLYATDVDTLKLSTNAGSTWSPIGASTFLAPLVVACKTTDPDVAIVAKFHLGNPSTAAVFRTVNGGSSWSDVTPSASLDFTPQRLVISAADPNYAFLGTERTSGDDQTTLWRSSDAGTNWSGISYFKDNAQPFVNDILCYPNTGSYADYIWVGGSTKDYVDEPDMETEGSVKRKGVWRSTNGGVNWTFQGDAMGSSDRNVTALAISIQTNTLLLAATTSGSQASIFQSTDYGATWSVSSNRPGGAVVRSMKVNPYNSDQILVATDEGVFMSANRGGTWGAQNTGLSAGSMNVMAIAYDLADTDGKTAYIATGTSVYKGTFGTSWSWSPAVTGTNYLNTTALAVQGGTLFAAWSGWDAVTKYSSGSWSIVSSTQDFVPGGTAVSTNASYAYASGALKSKGVIYRTTNGGTGWSQVKKLTVTPTSFTTLAADHKTNSTRVFAGLTGTGIGSNNFYYSTNSGEDWSQQLISDVNGVPVNAIAVDASTGSSYSTKIYAGLGSTKGIYRSTDGGASFSFLAMNSYSITAIALNSNTSALADTIYIAETTRMWKSTNGLASAPTELSIPFSGSGGAKAILMHPSYGNAANHVWVITGDGQKIYETKNGGANWSEVNTGSLPKPLHTLRRDPANDSLIYIATKDGVYKINTPPEIVTGVSGSIVSGTAYVTWNANVETDLVSNAYQVWRYNKTCSAGYCPNKICGPETDSVNIATTGNTYYHDTSTPVANCGTTGIGLGLVGYHIKAVDVAQVSGKSANKEFNKGMEDEWRPHVPGPIPDEVPRSFFLEANYPNPFNPTTQIRYGLPVSAHVHLLIVDALGREISVLVDKQQEAGTRSVEFNVSRLASGVYFYKLSAGEFTDIKKMIVTK